MKNHQFYFNNGENLNVQYLSLGDTIRTKYQEYFGDSKGISILDQKKHSSKNTKSSIESLQEQLLNAGFNPGKIDGIKGRRTQEAIDKAISEGFAVDENNNLISPKRSFFETFFQKSKKSFSPYDETGKLIRPSAKNAADLQECAYYANNSLNQANMGYYSGGNAWTRNHATGTSTIWSGYDELDGMKSWIPFKKHRDLGKFSEIASNERNDKAADIVKNKFDSSKLNKNKVYTVNMYFRSSPNKQKAWENNFGGNSGTHTGNLYWNEKENKWKVIDNVHGHISEVPVEQLLGSGKSKGITDVSEIYKANNSITKFLADKGIFLKEGGNINYFKEGGYTLPEVTVRPQKKNSVWNDFTSQVGGYFNGLQSLISRKVFGQKPKEEFINLSEKNLKFQDINKPKLNGSTIIGNIFNYKNEQKNQEIIGSKNSFYRGMKLGDDNVDIDKYSRWFGFQNGKLKVGSKDSFGNEDMISPVSNHDYLITGNVNDKTNIGSIREKFILYTGDGQNPVAITTGNPRQAINKYVAQYKINSSNPAHIIQLDAGRYGKNSTTSTHEYTSGDIPHGRTIWGITYD